MAASLNEALLNISKKAPKVQKTGINEHFESKFMELDAVMDVVLGLLNEEDVLFKAKLSTFAEGGRPSLKYSFHHVPTKESDGDEAPLMLLKASPQDLGSAVTYTRRYVLVTYLNLVTDKDDDGHAATQAARAAHDQATHPASLPPAETKAAPVVATAEQEMALRASIATRIAELKEADPDAWSKLEAWAEQREIDVKNPAADKLRALEGSLRRKVDAVRATAAKKAAVEAAKGTAAPAAPEKPAQAA